MLKVSFETQSYLRRDINLSMDSIIQPQMQSKVLTFFIFYNMTLGFNSSVTTEVVEI